MADGSVLIVRDNFGRFVVSASVETSGQEGDANGGAVSAVQGIANRLLLKEDSMTSWPTRKRCGVVGRGPSAAFF